MSTTRRARLAGMAVPLLLLGLALSGCGVADQQIRPGIAASVDGTDIASRDVDPTVDDTCAYLDAHGTNRFPRVTVRRLLVETLIRKQAAQKLLDELGASLPDTYAPALTEIKGRYTDASSTQAVAMRAGDTASTFVSAAGQAIGAALLRKETGAEPTDAQAVTDRGTKAIDDWLASHEVDLNPTYGLSLDHGTFVDDDGLSVPASTQAVLEQGAAAIDLTSTDQQALGEAITKATDSLPEDQVCGPAAAG